MNKPGRLTVLGGVTLLTLSGLAVVRADDGSVSNEFQVDQLPVEHAECVYFTGDQERFMDQALLHQLRRGRNTYRLSALTATVTGMLNYVPPDSRTFTFEESNPTGSIDFYIFGALKAHNIAPA